MLPKFLVYAIFSVKEPIVNLPKNRCQKLFLLLYVIGIVLMAMSKPFYFQLFWNITNKQILQAVNHFTMFTTSKEKRIQAAE